MPWINICCLLLCGHMSSANIGALSNKHLIIAAEPWAPFLMVYCPNGEENSYWEPCPGTPFMSHYAPLFSSNSFVQKALKIMLSDIKRAQN